MLRRLPFHHIRETHSVSAVRHFACSIQWLGEQFARRKVIGGRGRRSYHLNTKNIIWLDILSGIFVCEWCVCVEQFCLFVFFLSFIFGVCMREIVELIYRKWQLIREEVFKNVLNYIRNNCNIYSSCICSSCGSFMFEYYRHEDNSE